MTFEHLDDPAGFVPDDEFRAAAHRGGRRRRARRRLTLAGGSALMSIAVLVAAVAGYGLWRTSQIDRVDVDFAAPPVDLTEPFNVLLIGSDSREGMNADEVSGARSDTMIVMRVEPAERRLVLVSLPRDLVVTPLDGGEPVRLNASFAQGAPEVVRTIEAQLGIPLSAYLEVDFGGLVHLVDEAGGIPLSIGSTVRDEQTGLRLQADACASLDGATTLALLRSRHLEMADGSGGWVTDPSGDLGRMTRQRAVIAALLPRFGSLIDGFGGVTAALDVAAADLTIDDRLDVATLASLGRWAAEGPAPTVEQPILPVGSARLASGAVVLTLGDAAGEVVNRIGGTLPATALTSNSPDVAEAVGGVFSSEVGEVPIGPCV